MRYKIPIIIILICALFLCGCNKKESPAQVHFYYCNSRVDYGSASSVIGSEICKEPLDHLAYNRLLSTYLSGPQSQELTSPFPEGTSLISFTVEQQNAHVTLNRTFAQLTGVDLSIACACLSLTVRDITGCATVVISAQDALLDNQQSITVDANAIQLVDRVQP